MKRPRKFETEEQYRAYLYITYLGKLCVGGRHHVNTYLGKAEVLTDKAIEVAKQAGYFK